MTSYRDIGRALGRARQPDLPATVEKLVALADRVDSATVGQYLESAL